IGFARRAEHIQRIAAIVQCPLRMAQKTGRVRISRRCHRSWDGGDNTMQAVALYDGTPLSDIEFDGILQI
ncbi:hypothetical protein R0J91_20745, partial [Micrococcus sp. SIMBA_131]